MVRLLQHHKDTLLTIKMLLKNTKKEYSQYWNAILSGTGEITLDETEETFENENEPF